MGSRAYSIRTLLVSVMLICKYLSKLGSNHRMKSAYIELGGNVMNQQADPETHSYER